VIATGAALSPAQAALSPAQKSGGGEIAAGMAPLIAGSRRGVNAKTTHAKNDTCQDGYISYRIAPVLPAALGTDVYATRFART
jgi:hypothetical protein